MKKSIFKTEILFLFLLLVQPAFFGCSNRSEHPASDTSTTVEKEAEKDEPQAEASEQKAEESKDEHPSSSEHPE